MCGLPLSLSAALKSANRLVTQKLLPYQLLFVPSLQEAKLDPTLGGALLLILSLACCHILVGMCLHLAVEAIKVASQHQATVPSNCERLCMISIYFVCPLARCILRCWKSPGAHKGVKLCVKLDLINIQAYFGGTAGSAPDHCSKTSHSDFSSVPSACKSYVCTVL